MFKKIVLLVVLLTPLTASANDCTSNYVELRNIAIAMGWKVTADVGKKHNGGSKHYTGKAVDVSVRGKTEFHIIALEAVLQEHGFGMIDERVRPKNQRVWTAPHLHLFIPDCRR